MPNESRDPTHGPMGQPPNFYLSPKAIRWVRMALGNEIDRLTAIVERDDTTEDAEADAIMDIAYYKAIDTDLKALHDKLIPESASGGTVDTLGLNPGAA